ncbi:virulence protein RhuM/Fic/DOC family protein [Candidatus Odyssella thessalonicensis]|uniref:virulence protein RhuM/Fic/DOC family protein n=1 Tax=Candidatus Odyssella thessalonicensis TaxID=84647 RepID=UPI000225AF92|nr:virulence protein RhuM/Fic/DOC family protein [Candidatus Odyssella thessalonicensis]
MNHINTDPQNQMLIYQSEDGSFQTEVRLESDSVWLSQKQMSELFGTSTDNIGLHLKNIYTEGELSEDGTTEAFSVVQLEGKRKIKRHVKHYNLDAIISVGYRVNSKQGTQFRIWANKVLKGYLLEGYALNESRLRQQIEKIVLLKETLAIFQRAQQESLANTEAQGLLSLLTEYTHSFVLLNQYDTGNLPREGLSRNVSAAIDEEEAILAVKNLKEKLMAQNEATPLFGQTKDDSFKGILGNIIQSFDGKYLYPSIEEQAAHLLYFIVKNHPFTDGNKRIGAFMFIWFLQRNMHHLKKSGEPKINDNALVAITLLVAQSQPVEKDIMIDLIVNLIKEQSSP